jgi:hypothetical protein
VRRDLEAEAEPGLKAAAVWLKEHTKKDDIVYTADWDDFPQLWYYNHHNRYLICLDPMFFYQFDRDLWQLWFDTSNVRLQDIYNPIRHQFHARWVLATNDFSNLTKKCNSDPRFRKVHADPHATIYEVLDDLPDFVTSWSLSGAYPNDLVASSETLVMTNIATPSVPVPPAGGLALGLEWKPWPADQLGSFIDMERYIVRRARAEQREDLILKEGAHAYAACRVGSPVDQDAELALGFDDAVTVWQDGKVVLDEHGPSEVSLDARRETIHLKKGASTLLIRTMNYKGNWGFMARLKPASRPLTLSPLVPDRSAR